MLSFSTHWFKTYYFIVFIIFTSFIIFIVFRLSKDDIEPNSKSNTVFTSELNSGDLVFVSYRNSLGKFMKVWSGSKWTHVGIAYRDSDNKLYIMETSNYDEPYRGVILMPISEWNQYNRNQEISVKKINEINSEDLLKNFTKIYDKNLDTFGLSWFRLISKRPFENLQDKENITCFELVAYLLQECNVIKKDLSPSSFFPIDMIKENFTINKEYNFDKLKRLKL
jgi:hypothetical protein